MYSLRLWLPEMNRMNNIIHEIRQTAKIYLQYPPTREDNEK